jgi:hypothetical protein
MQVAVAHVSHHHITSSPVRTETRDAFKFKFKFSSVEGGSLEMPGASTSKGRVAPALGLPADETLFDARGVILLTHAPQTGVSIFEALLGSP